MLTVAGQDLLIRFSFFIARSGLAVADKSIDFTFSRVTGFMPIRDLDTHKFSGISESSLLQYVFDEEEPLHKYDGNHLAEQ